MEVLITIIVVAGIIAAILIGYLIKLRNELVKGDVKIDSARFRLRAAYDDYLMASERVPELEEIMSEINVRGNREIMEKAGTVTGSNILAGGNDRFPHYTNQNAGRETFERYIRPVIEAKTKLIEECEAYNTRGMSFPNSLFAESLGFVRRYPEKIIQTIIKTAENGMVREGK